MPGKTTGSRRSRTAEAFGAFAVIVVSLAACGSSAQTVGSAPAPARRPNIVFVLTDDLAMNLVQYMPRVLRMQQEGVTFGNYFVTDSLCCP